jgi:hypothetical protein
VTEFHRIFMFTDVVNASRYLKYNRGIYSARCHITVFIFSRFLKYQPLRFLFMKTCTQSKD